MSSKDKIRWDATLSESLLIGHIVKRARAAAPSGAAKHRALELTMSLTACHLNGCPLDLQRMLDTDDELSLIHDVFGIHRHISRETGQLQNIFLPRFAKKERT